MHNDKGKIIQFPKQHDAVNHPQHYCDGGIETIDFIKAKLGTLGFYYYCMGNVMKYSSRIGKKGAPLEDIGKMNTYARWAEEALKELNEPQEAQV